MRHAGARLDQRHSGPGPLGQLPPLAYEVFHRAVRILCRRSAGQTAHRPSPVAIAALRRALPELPQKLFDEYLWRMERNELVHLLPADDPSVLSEEDRRNSVVDPSGGLRSFLIYLGARRRPPVFWD